MSDRPRLGASLYVPATHSDLCAIAAGTKLAAVRSLIFCTEDAVAPHDLPCALDNLATALEHLQPREGCLRFVRVRNPDVLDRLLTIPSVHRLDGFVFPKISLHNIDDYFDRMACGPQNHFWVMPTLETREVFHDAAMHALAEHLDRAPWRAQILGLRIGGNDLLALLRMRRPKGRTIYETPLGHVIARLATTFIPYGFPLSAPVFEHYADTATLEREIVQDLHHGLTGKTAIHPTQVPLIERHYRVAHQDLEAAMRILGDDAPGVFSLHHSMCEPSTHRPWANEIVAAARQFGCVPNAMESME
ncbi:HpcH/HpaI aldolase/citrate lyase family protein [Candidatus Symbiobacter mobilis]|uniref:Citrate lyase subunit beta n=1 Tax=Candidatus Symbiobacter mobilis CR TaxID=946483 RepID=U5N7G9_9BURK|nr:HpcH/HpaI aldolase/citrate lyase family protein [Candidatus Symbiobacter mobilis]AGX87260.1 citrate lyase subunit beta [Candidatus Symbiobacter mobilis CR]